MRYFFHILNEHSRFDDEAGTILSGPQAARLQATVIAAELAQDGDTYAGFVVLAIDEHGNEIARAPVIAIEPGAK